MHCFLSLAFVYRPLIGIFFSSSRHCYENSLTLNCKFEIIKLVLWCSFISAAFEHLTEFKEEHLAKARAGIARPDRAGDPVGEEHSPFVYSVSLCPGFFLLAERVLQRPGMQFFFNVRSREYRPRQPER